MIPKIVVARYSENLDWLKQNDLYKNAIIYNKGLSVIRSCECEIIHRPNRPIFGREGETYLYHIISNYDKLDDYTIFTQANPFDHNEQFIELIHFLNETNSYKNYQSLTYKWNDEYPYEIPPTNILEYDKTEWIDNKYKIRSEVIDDDLCQLSYKDFGFYNVLWDFKKTYNLSMSEKILPFLYKKLSINKPYINYPRFNFGAIFGVSKQNILQHNLDFYKGLHRFVCEYKANGFILERLWYTILC